jgi:predicted nucleic acid-binding Zn ribbon protein
MPRGPQAIGDVLSELMARRGYARVQTGAAYDAAWREAAGPLAAKYSRPGPLRRGTLEVLVANSTLMQELGFQKAALLEALGGLLPDEGITNLRFRVGNLR